MRPAFIVLGLLLAVGVAIVALRLRGREPVQVILPPPAAPQGEVRVHVTGAVASPGVYTLSADARVEDALRAAGGATADADLEQVNLAARLRDSQQVVVPVRQPAAEAPGGPRVNLNTASLDELRGVPGIGDVRARRIIQSREQDGPYQETVDLLERRILTPAIYERVRAYFVVR